ncbi:hypothetical protein B0H17DRAFT_1160667 [Mycena rosella]|uniref:Peptidase M43 pregnancy-associated plasma-A domain-containing protein n=1 Tax=Mycena rosella TaxID=1033263 RepID=A0AAD7DAZ7_MYCRO|nr:hypothetical protein B0H17DRAFT_1160667 [Mycena rosella]
MLTTTSLTLLLTASVTLGGCATHIEPEEIVVAERYFDANKTEPAEKIANTVVKVYWHVITKDSTLAGGHIPDFQIANEINVLNNDYTGNITCTLANTSRTVNADLFNNAGPSTAQQTAMKASRQGGKGDLNVYSVGFVNGPGAGLLGYSTFPSSYSGATLTHESAHWLGLYHTFQGGCAGSGTATAGDYSAAASGCPSGRDTCTGTSFPGADPVTNFMDYFSDACMTHFSAGQMSRATTQFATYRA